MLDRCHLATWLLVAAAGLLQSAALALAETAPAGSARDARATLSARAVSPVHTPNEAAPPSPRPALKKPEKGTWPFKRWSYAKAYTYNFFMDRPVPLQVVARNGSWSEHIRSGQLVTEAQALNAARLVHRSRGTFETSSCTFPRHAIVYFDRSDKPVAAASICFECEGVLVWPDYEHDDDPTPQTFLAREKKFMRALAGWKKLFGGELGLPLAYDGQR